MVEMSKHNGGEQPVNADSSVNGQSGTEEDDVLLEEEVDEDVAPVHYRITSYGIDFDVDGLCRRLENGEIVIPQFQRSFVWSIRLASRFIESLLLGLPIPGIFLSQDFDSGKFIVIDGQQRLKSIQLFRSGMFAQSSGGKSPVEFKLTGVQESFKGLMYQNLASQDRFRLDNSVIHATVVKQDAPAGDNTSVYHVFDRINTGGLHLSQQEIRSAICHGKMIDHLGNLNKYPAWRELFGKEHSRQRDQELILRFLAFYYNESLYKPPMSEFLTKFAQEKKIPTDNFLKESTLIFTQTMDAFRNALGARAFRFQSGHAFNAAMFDSMAVALGREIASSVHILESEQIQSAHHSLLQDIDYLKAVSRATAREEPVKVRMKKAAEMFAEL